MAPFALPSSTMTVRPCVRSVPLRNAYRIAPRRQRAMAAPVAELQTTQQRINQHPDPNFIKETLAAFPDEGVANVEQALVRRVHFPHAIRITGTLTVLIKWPQVLYLEGGYKFFDVRSDRERDFGAIRGSIHVPYTKDKKSWVDGKMSIEKTKIDGWIKSVNAKIPKKDTKLIVHDMMGKQARCAMIALLIAVYMSELNSMHGSYYLVSPTIS